MIYSNFDDSAILALERARTGNYGEDYEDEFWGDYYEEDDYDEDEDEYFFEDEEIGADDSSKRGTE